MAIDKSKIKLVIHEQTNDSTGVDDYSEIDMVLSDSDRDIIHASISGDIQHDKTNAVYVVVLEAVKKALPEHKNSNLFMFDAYSEGWSISHGANDFILVRADY